MDFLCSRFCLLCSKQESVEFSLWGKHQDHENIHTSRNLKIVYCISCYSLEALIRRFQSVWISFSGQFRGFEKSWMSPMVITKLRQLWSIFLIILNGKKHLVAKIPTLINNNTSQSIRSIARDMSVCVSYQAVIAWRHSAFLIQDVKGPGFFFQMENMKNWDLKLLNKRKYPLQPNMFCFFSDEKIPIELKKELLACSGTTKMKSKHSVYIMVSAVVTSDRDVMQPFILQYGPKFNIEAYIKYQQELTWIEREAIGKLYVWQQDFPPCRTSPLTSGHLTP